jgi:tRNA G18 (ribose-2'-O)-methylase SpoU
LATPIHITDANDPRIEAYSNIRERDLVGRQGLFIAEGDVVLRLMLKRSRFETESILLSERRVNAMGELIAKIPESIPVYIGSDSMIEGIAGFPVHRGILALGSKSREIQTASTLIQALPDKALVVVCIGIANHDNMGGIFRNAAAFGASAVLLDHTCCDPLYRKAIRVSVGASLVVPFVLGETAGTLIRLLHDAGFKTFALSPAGKVTLADVKPSNRTALILGAEGPGLPKEILQAVASVTIPMAGDFDSLNVATTSGIALYQFKNRA